MQRTQKFYDCCIPYTSDEEVFKNILDELVNLDYKTIAIEQVFQHSKTNAKGRGAEVFPEPVDIKKWQIKYEDKLQIHSRITIVYSDPSVVQDMAKSLLLKKYTIVAAQPSTEEALVHCCKSFNGDLVTFDPEVGSSVSLHHRSLKIALQREIYFELKYSIVIRNSVVRRNMIRLAHKLVRRGKTKNVVLSSGALNAFELRSPYDVANLSYMFGLAQDQGKNGVDRTCQQLFKRAELRSFGKSFIVMNPVESLTYCSASDSDENTVDVELTETSGVQIATSDEEPNNLRIDETPASEEETSSDNENYVHTNKKLKFE